MTALTLTTIIAAAIVADLALAVAIGKLLARRSAQPDTWKRLVDACQSDTPLYDGLAGETGIDPIAAEQIRSNVMDELAARRDGAR